MNTLSTEELGVGMQTDWLAKVGPGALDQQISGILEDRRYRGETASGENRSRLDFSDSYPDREFDHQSPRLDFAFSDLPHDRFQCLQQWEGTVLEVSDQEFTVRLSDLTRDGIEEEATLAVADVNSDDMVLLRPGAIFYLNLGYRICRSGQRVRGISLKFRRLPPWDADEILNARERAHERLKRIVRE